MCDGHRASPVYLATGPRRYMAISAHPPPHIDIDTVTVTVTVTWWRWPGDGDGGYETIKSIQLSSVK